MEKQSPKMNYVGNDNIDNKNIKSFKYNKLIKICGWIIIILALAPIFSVYLIDTADSSSLLFIRFFIIAPLLVFVKYLIPIFALLYIVLIIFRRKKIKKMDVSVLISIVIVFFSYSFLKNNLSGKEKFYSYVASTFNIPEFCEKISPNLEGASAPWTSRGYQKESIRSDCFLDTAVHFRRPELCKKVEPFKSINIFLDGSKINESHCLSEVEMEEWSYGKGTLDSGSVAGLFRKLGYSDEEMGSRGTLLWPLIFELREKIIKDDKNPTREEFIKRVNEFAENNIRDYFDFVDIEDYLKQSNK